MEQPIGNNSEIIELTRFEMEVILTSLKLRKYVLDDIDRGNDFNDTEKESF